MPVRHIALIVEVQVDRQQSAELDERPYLVRGQIQEHLQLMFPTQQVVVSGFQVMDGPNPTHVLIDKDSVLAEDMAKHGYTPDGVFPEAENLTEITDEERVSRRAVHQKFRDALADNNALISKVERVGVDGLDEGERLQLEKKIRGTLVENGLLAPDADNPFSVQTRPMDVRDPVQVVEQSKDGKRVIITAEMSDAFKDAVKEGHVIMPQPQGRHGTRPINNATPSTATPTPPAGGSGQSCQSSEELPRPDRPDNVTSIGKAREKRRWKGKR